jgi:DNA-binding transcriptional LysR family regulator
MPLEWMRTATFRQINHTEEVAGTRLFDRIGKRVSFVEAGEILLDHARQILQWIRGWGDLAVA